MSHLPMSKNKNQGIFLLSKFSWRKFHYKVTRSSVEMKMFVQGCVPQPQPYKLKGLRFTFYSQQFLRQINFPQGGFKSEIFFVKVLYWTTVLSQLPGTKMMINQNSEVYQRYGRDLKTLLLSAMSCPTKQSMHLKYHLELMNEKIRKRMPLVLMKKRSRN